MRRTWMIGLATLGLVAGSGVAAAAPRGGGENAFQVRVGGFFPSGDDEFWAETEEVFNLEASDLDAAFVGFSLVHATTNSIEFGFNVDFIDETVGSSYRDYVDEDGFPIGHDTRLELLPVTVDVRLYPAGRYRMRPHGRRVNRPAFYVGAGLGMNVWEYEENGFFIDFGDPDLAVFPGRFVDDGVAFEAHALAGVELPVAPSFNLLLEGRYSWSDDELGGDFAGFGKIDLGGASLQVGGSWRF